ncbi:hypothetical protein RFI_33288 [Reticulomyxa filosa]|uniref:Uncharacterized protein n=1 Tax=Reticulomyxa filosa TaxID=46433 RepID=X6LR56_RETFI|nr:hypothetical protein RFI_33288 [Reticulomyxa filosa]|eukprot:ETO04114.1 hypothetical protein RFI_33288 [Reticulomyxa filosa]
MLLMLLLFIVAVVPKLSWLVVFRILFVFIGNGMCSGVTTLLFINVATLLVDATGDANVSPFSKLLLDKFPNVFNEKKFGDKPLATKTSSFFKKFFYIRTKKKKKLFNLILFILFFFFWVL